MAFFFFTVNMLGYFVAFLGMCFGVLVLVVFFLTEPCLDAL